MITAKFLLFTFLLVVLCSSCLGQSQDSDDGVWQSLCNNEGINAGNCTVSSWENVYNLMSAHKQAMDKEMEEYKKRYDSWQERQRGIACGMRGPPPQPKIQHPTDSKEVTVPSSFPAHPSSSTEGVLPFSVDLLHGAVYYLELMINAAKHEQFMEQDFLQQAVQKYVNFLHLKHKYKKSCLVPTLEIEYVWVSHMLRPSMYISDCTKLFGEVIDHSIMLTSTYEYLNRAQALADTKELYEKEFGGSYCDLEIIESLRTVPHFNRYGIAPLSTKELLASKPDEGEVFRKPVESVPIKYAPSFVDHVGIATTAKWESELDRLSDFVAQMYRKLIKTVSAAEKKENTDNELPVNSISLTVSDLMMDHMWLGEYEKFMKDAVANPLDTSEIYGTSWANGNPSKMSTKNVYKCIMKAYEKFLYMAAKYPPSQGTYVHPTYAIDVMWHTHMIHPKIYAKEVNEWVGYLVDHEPWPNCKSEDMTNSVDNTNDLWMQEFGVSLNDEHITRMRKDGDKDSWWNDD